MPERTIPTTKQIFIAQIGGFLIEYQRKLMLALLFNSIIPVDTIVIKTIKIIIIVQFKYTRNFESYPGSLLYRFAQCSKSRPPRFRHNRLAHPVKYRYLVKAVFFMGSSYNIKVTGRTKRLKKSTRDAVVRSRAATG